jgi:hypothetical protein
VPVIKPAQKHKYSTKTGEIYNTKTLKNREQKILQEKAM